MRKNHKWLKKEEKDNIINLYKSGLSSRQVALKINITKTTVLKILKKNNLTRKDSRYRKYSINSNFLKDIKNENQAYITGLFYADGCNDIKNNKAVLTLHQKDVGLLSKISKIINSDRKLYKNNNCYNLIVCNKEFCKFLYKTGCVNKKSLVLEFPTQNQIPASLLNHFIRGYFDGDGCIHFSKSGPEISIVSSENFIKKLCFFINKELQMNLRLRKIKNTRACVFRIGGRRQVLKFLNYMYKNANIFLERKYEKYLRLIKITKNEIKNNAYMTNIKSSSKIKLEEVISL